MRELLISVLFSSSAVLTLGYYALLRRYVPASGHVLSVKKFLPLWLALFTFEFIFLGPFSYVNMDVDGNLAVVMNHFLAQYGDGGRFAHQFSGGQDQYVWFLGMQYFNPEMWLSHILPTWLVIEFHKLMIGALGFMGTYLLAKRVAPGNEMLALGLGAAYPVSHIYLTDYSLSFGTGFAAIPIAVYWCIGCTGSKRYWWLVAASAIVLAAADPMKVFPPLLVAYVGGVILIEDVDLRRALGAFAVCIILSVLNWHEVLFALASVAPSVGRGWSAGIEQATQLMEASSKSVNAAAAYWLPAGLLAVSFGLLAARRDRYAIPAAAAVAWVVLAMIVADAFPWETVGLSFLNRLSHQQYMVLALSTVAIPVAARAIAGADGARLPMLPRFDLRLPLVLLAVALGVLTYQKGFSLAYLVFTGGQAAYGSIDSLANPAWGPKPGYRTVTFYETPNANVVAGFYGYDTFDGQLNLNNWNWARYWLAIVHGNTRHNLTTRPGWYWKFWDGKSYDVERHVRINLLAVANVRYLFSPLPLASASLTLLHAPAKDKWARVRPDFFDGFGSYLAHRLKRVFDAGDVFVYELPDALPRAFGVTDVVSVPESVNEKAFFNAIGNAAIKRAAVTRAGVAARLGNARPMEVRRTTTVRDGYDIAVDAPEGGVLVLNQVPFPFWRAFDQDGRALPPEPVNGIHMAVTLLPGTRCVRFRYERPLLRERLFGGGGSGKTDGGCTTAPSL